MTELSDYQRIIEKPHIARLEATIKSQSARILSLIEALEKAERELAEAREAALEEAAKVCEAHLNNIEADDPYRKKDRQHCDEMDTADGYLRNAAEAIRALKTAKPRI